MKIFVTGAHGFLGQHIVSAIRTRGHVVIGPSRTECDLLGPWQEIVSHLDGADAVVHAAADVGGLAYVQAGRLGLMRRNLRMTLNLLEAAEHAGTVKLLVGVGSACSYPNLGRPLSEEDFWEGPCHASVETYGGYKRTMELLVRQGPWTPLHLVLANLYGPGDRHTGNRGHVLTALVDKVVRAKRAATDKIEAWAPDPKREFLYIENAGQYIADATNAYIDGARVEGDILNIGTGQSHRIDEIMSMIQKAAGVQIPVRWNPAAPRGVDGKVLDVTRLRSLLGSYQPMPLGAGIARTVAWYEAHETDVPVLDATSIT